MGRPRWTASDRGTEPILVGNDTGVGRQASWDNDDRHVLGLRHGLHLARHSGGINRRADGDRRGAKAIDQA